MSVIHGNSENFDKEVIDSEKLVVIDFWAPWCGPCKMMGPVFEELSNEITDVKFVKINTDEAGDIANRFGIRGIPSLLFVKNGKEIERIVGFRPKEELIKIIEEMKTID